MFKEYLAKKLRGDTSVQENAEHAIVLDENDSYTVASQIALNLKGEWDAIEGYQKLIPFFKLHKDKEAEDEIREIISDELNHAKVLQKIMRRYDENIPVNPD